VSVVGGDSAIPAVDFHLKSASKSEVHNLAVTGAGPGFFAAGVADLVISSVWVHDTASEGRRFNGSQSLLTSVTMTDSLIEGAHNVGMGFYGTDATIEQSVVRDTEAGTYDLGEGVVAAEGVVGTPGKPANVTIRRSLFRTEPLRG